MGSLRRIALRAGAVGAGVAAGLLIAGAALVAMDTLRHRPEALDAADRAALSDKLDRDPGTQFRFDPELAYTLKPRYVGVKDGCASALVHTNSLGLVGPELAENTARGRILILGDSIVYGFGVADGDSMAASLQRQASEGLEFVNGGTPGWGTFQEVRFFERQLGGEPWHRVVLVFCQNDLLRYGWNVTQDGRFIMSEEVLELGGRRGVTTTLRSARIASLRLRMRMNRRTRPLNRHKNNALIAWVDTEWREYESQILPYAISTIGRDRLIVTALPTAAQVEASRRGADHAFGFSPQRRSEAFFEREGVPFIDPAPAFLATGRSDLFLDQLHPTPAGHRVAAEALWPRLKPLL